MKKLILSTALLAASASFCFAQNTPDGNADSKKIFDHTLGVQMNELIRQVFNFNNSTNNNLNNPYLLYYSLTHAKTGVGIRAGVGYNYQDFTNDDGITKSATNNDVLNARFGFEKTFKLSGRFSAGVGVDALYATDKNKTVTKVIGLDTVVTTVKTNMDQIGGGAMGWLRYNVNNNIQIGTETSFYYQTGDKKQDIKVVTVRRVGGGGTTTTTESNTDGKESSGVFRMPVVFYLLIKF